MELNFGTGGLVKAYTDAAVLGLQNLEIIYKSKGMEISLSLGYDEYDNLKRNIDLFNKENNIEYIKILEEEFLEKINLNIFLSYDKFENIEDFKDKIIKNINIEDIKIIKESIK